MPPRSTKDAMYHAELMKRCC